MALPQANPNPPFNITRAAHVVLTARDLAASRTFYEQVLGFIVTAAGDDVLHLRGVEERGHHSLTIRRDAGKAVCRRIGLRVAGHDDIARAEDHLSSKGLAPRRVDVPHQGATLHFADPAGVPYELCAAMTTVPSLRQEFHAHHSASPQRLDHVQIIVPDVSASTAFLMNLGFRLAEYTATDGTDDLWGAWLQRKGNPQDIVYANGPGPRLHHFAYPVPETRDIIHVCDVAENVERGPGRHGIGNALFVYLRDPDGHRVELFIGHYQAIDAEDAPIRWDLTNTRRSQLWGLPARASWFNEATEFDAVPVTPPTLNAPPVTLESFLASQA
jgi:catechol 2,3-dioxygenase